MSLLGIWLDQPVTIPEYVKAEIIRVVAWVNTAPNSLLRLPHEALALLGLFEQSGRK